MKLNLKALALAAGTLWALALFMTGATNLIWPPYGDAFLKVMASVYPGYHALQSIRDVIIGTAYAFLDGAIFGLVFGWIYNVFVGRRNFSK